MSESPLLPSPPVNRPDLRAVDFDQAPFLVIWETTQACDLACLHCRAAAHPTRDDRELSTLEAMGMMNRIRRFGRPLFVLTGGDPAKRPDLVELVRHGARIGLRMGLTPSGTPLVTPDLIRELRDAGLSRLAVSLDGPTPEKHDRFRGVAGSYAWTIGILEAASELGISTQVNTTVSGTTLPDFDAMSELVMGLGIALWSVFFLVPVGRGRTEELPSPDELERVFHRMYDLSLEAPFDIKSTAAPQYRRVVLERQVAARKSGDRDDPVSPLGGGVGFSLADGVGRSRGVNDGNGFLFINHRGDLFPSGFLPVAAGNVREDDPVAVYRDHELFRALRDPDLLKGKCGVCEYRSVCGGSRARAWALTGDALEADPSCAHIPARYRRQVAQGEAEAVDSYFRRRVPGWGRPSPVGKLPTCESGISGLPVLCPTKQLQ